MGGVLIVLALLLLYLFNPTEHAWFPQCMFHRLTGWQCPSCGSQRAFHALLHGHLWEALSYNPFLLVTMPYVAIILYAYLSGSQRAQTLKRIFLSPTAVYIYLTLFFVWWVGRNLLGI